MQSPFEILEDNHLHEDIENVQLVFAHANPVEAARALVSLKYSYNLTDENRAVIAHNPDPVRVAQALNHLDSSGLLNDFTRAIVSNYLDPYFISDTMVLLDNAGLLFDDVLQIIAASSHLCPNALVAFNHDTLPSLRLRRILTKENFIEIFTHPNLKQLNTIINHLANAGILTQANFDALLSPQLWLLSSQDGYDLVWSQIPMHPWTQPSFDQLCQLALEDDPLGALAAFTHDLLVLQPIEFEIVAPHVDVGQQVNPNHVLVLNDNQSTHTASVHQSISESAARLWQRYGESLLTQAQLKSVIENMKQWILCETEKISAAMRGFERITDPNAFSFVDPVSEVSALQMLALSHLAIFDEENRHGTLEDAMRQIIQGLYEIQRGYNLSEDGVENGGDDLPICAAGTFNKLVEKLSGIHTDVCIRFVTYTTATLKLPIIVEEEAYSFLLQSACADSLSNLYAFIKLLDRVSEEGISVIWPNIEEPICARMLDEFGCLMLTGSISQKDFTSLIEAGQYKELRSFKCFQQKISHSQGYYQYLSQTLRYAGIFAQVLDESLELEKGLKPKKM